MLIQSLSIKLQRFCEVESDRLLDDYKKMIQNLVYATAYNVVALPLGAGVLFWAGIMINPAVGAVLMSLSTVAVAVNAQFLRKNLI